MSVQPQAGVGDSAASLQGSAGCWMQERRQEGLEGSELSRESSPAYLYTLSHFTFIATL